MSRPIEPVTVDEYGDERHPAWVLIGASRVSHGGSRGAVLFDSDVQHHHYVMVRLRRASRKRDHGHDWKFGRETLFEIAMSEAQWASFVSSMNVGDGVPATLEWDATVDGYEVPGMPYQPRLQLSYGEVHAAAEKVAADVRAAFDRYAEKKTAENLRSLQATIQNMTPNIDYAAEKLGEHAENVVQRSRADVEAFVAAKASQLGIDPADIGGLPELTP